MAAGGADAISAIANALSNVMQFYKTVATGIIDVINNGAASLAAKNQSLENDKQFAQGKEMAWYDLALEQSQSDSWTMIVGMIALAAIIIVMIIYKKSK